MIQISSNGVEATVGRLHISVDARPDQVKASENGITFETSPLIFHLRRVPTEDEHITLLRSRLAYLFGGGALEVEGFASVEMTEISRGYEAILFTGGESPQAIVLTVERLEDEGGEE